MPVGAFMKHFRVETLPGQKPNLFDEALGTSLPATRHHFDTLAWRRESEAVGLHPPIRQMKDVTCTQYSESFRTGQVLSKCQSHAFGQLAS